MKTLKIEIPEGFEVDTFDQQSGEIRFREKPKDVKERIKTVADVLADNGLEWCRAPIKFCRVQYGPVASSCVE